MFKITNTLKFIRDKEFVPIVLMCLLIMSITWGTKLLGIRDTDGDIYTDTANAAGGTLAPANAGAGASLKPSVAPITTKTPNFQIMKIAHRGAKKFAPENTLPSFQKAIEMGYDYAELDVRYSSDGVPVIMHDANMLRTTGLNKLIAESTLAEIKKADAGSWFSPKFAGTRVPTLEEVLQLMKGRIKLYLDQKAPPTPALIELLKKYNFLPDNIVVVGGDEYQAAFRKLYPGAPVMPNISTADDIAMQLNRFPVPTAFNLNCSELTAEIIKKAHENGVMIFANTLEISSFFDRDMMRRTIKAGADAIQFDSMDTFSSVLQEIKKKGK